MCRGPGEGESRQRAGGGGASKMPACVVGSHDASAPGQAAHRVSSSAIARCSRADALGISKERVAANVCEGGGALILCLQPLIGEN